MNLACMRGYSAWEAFVGALRGALTCVGVLVIAFVAIEGVQLVMSYRSGGSGAQVSAAATDHDTSTQHALRAEAARVAAERRALANYLARRYRVAPEPVEEVVGAAFAVGRSANIDPLLILAVISVESRFNPIAESEYGARGLMQVVPRFHLEKLAHHGGEATLLEPHTNMLVGTQILDEYVRRAGSLEAGLQLYAGAAEDPDKSYAQRVLLEQRRLQQVRGSVQVRTAAVAGETFRN
jgi:soluble lytic murein transglycosylase-like protein